MSLKLMGPWYALGINLSADYNYEVSAVGSLSEEQENEIVKLDAGCDNERTGDVNLTARPTPRTLINPRLMRVHPIEDIESCVNVADPIPLDISVGNVQQ